MIDTRRPRHRARNPRANTSVVIVREMAVTFIVKWAARARWSHTSVPASRGFDVRLLNHCLSALPELVLAGVRLPDGRSKRSKDLVQRPRQRRRGWHG